MDVVYLFNDAVDLWEDEPLTFEDPTALAELVATASRKNNIVKFFELFVHGATSIKWTKSKLMKLATRLNLKPCFVNRCSKYMTCDADGIYHPTALVIKKWGKNPVL